MITPEKIEAWIAEALERPESAARIIQSIANRLAELTRQIETLREENIALQSGARVEEYEKRIAHLEYQLALIRRQMGGELTSEPESEQSPASKALAEPPSLLLYDSLGRVARWQLDPELLSEGATLGFLAGELTPNEEPLRMLAVSPREELLFLFTSGRIATMDLAQLPLTPAEQPLPGSPPLRVEWKHSLLPVEPKAGERLACVAPFSRLALAKYFVQTSRKGCLKKIRAALGQSILANRYLGPGTRKPSDQPFDLALCEDGDLLALVTHEGYLQCLAVDELPPMLEEALRLGAGDYLVGAFILVAGRAILVMTQVGKVIHWTEDRLEVAHSFHSKGQALFSAARREQGVRVIGAGSISEADWAVALHRSGRLSLHAANTLLRAGAIPVEKELLAFCFFSPHKPELPAA